MKTFLILPALAACLCLGVQAQTAALDTKTVTVAATVLNTCKFESGVINLALSALDPSSSVNATQTSSVSFSCTNGYPVQVGIQGVSLNSAATGGIPMTLTHSNGTAALPYALKTSFPNGTTGKGFGAGNTLKMDLTAEVQPSEFQNALGGSYTGSLTLQLTP